VLVAAIALRLIEAIQSPISPAICARLASIPTKLDLGFKWRSLKPVSVRALAINAGAAGPHFGYMPTFCRVGMTPKSVHFWKPKCVP
jgi:hypothetical protein